MRLRGGEQLRADAVVWAVGKQKPNTDFVPVPGKGLLDDTYTGLRGAAIVPGARINAIRAPTLVVHAVDDGLQRGDSYGYTSELLQIDAKLSHRITSSPTVCP